MQTISEILDYLTQQIIRTMCNLDLLQSLRDRIAAAVTPPEPVAAVPSVPSVPSVACRAARPSKAPRSKAVRHSGSMFGRIVAAVASIDGEITTKALSAALPDIRPKVISDALCKLKRQRQLTSTSYGIYVKSTHYFKPTTDKAAAYAEFRAGLEVKVPEVQLKSPESRSKAV